MNQTVLYEVQGPVAWLTLNRPQKLNAITFEMNDGLAAALSRAEQDDNVKVIALRGAGRAFSAGHDLNEEVSADLQGADRWLSFLERHHDAVRALWACPKAVIAAVHGHCVGGGFEFALACDLIIAAEDAEFGHVEIRYGSGPVTLMLPFLIPDKLAREMLLTGETVTAEKAHQFGLVNRVVPAEDLSNTVLEYAAKIAPAPLTVLRLTKISLTRAQAAMGLFSGQRAHLDISAMLNAAETADQREFDRIVSSDGLKAALHWREARYTNLSASR